MPNPQMNESRLSLPTPGATGGEVTFDPENAAEHAHELQTHLHFAVPPSSNDTGSTP